MLENLALGLAVQWEYLPFMVLGTLGGMWVGVMPGLGPITATALLIPLTFTMGPLAALLMLASISAAANCSGLSPPSCPTCPERRPRRLPA